jgi:hypothetical protein
MPYSGQLLFSGSTASLVDHYRFVKCSAPYIEHHYNIGNVLSQNQWQQATELAPLLKPPFYYLAT